jgi:hypothetical protein
LVTQLANKLAASKEHASAHLFFGDVEQEFSFVEQTYVSRILEIFTVLASCAKVLDPGQTSLM